MGELPFVSVLIPVRNEGDFIERSLGAVLAQRYPPERMEILVIDGMSEDDTRERVLDLAHKNPDHRVRILDNPRQIAPTALNRGLSEAVGEIVIRVDGHCEVGPDYLEHGVAHLLAGEADGVGGVLETVPANPQAAAISTAMSSIFGVGGSRFRTADRLTESQQVDTVAFPAYSREAIQRAGAFDEELVRNQDDEYNYRLRKLGGTILLVADMPSRYHTRATLRSLARQYFQYGMWKVRVLQKHPRQMKARQFAPALLVLAIGVSSVAALLEPALGLPPLLLLLGLYGSANLAASLIEGRRTSPGQTLRLPAVFSILHFAYGTGFLTGLVVFCRRWGDRQGRTPELTLAKARHE